MNRRAYIFLVFIPGGGGTGSAATFLVRDGGSLGLSSFFIQPVKRAVSAIIFHQNHQHETPKARCFAR